MAAGASTLAAVQPPLPLSPGGSHHVGDGVSFLEDAEGNGSVFLWGMAAWSWDASDRVARRLAAVQLVNTRAARQRDVASAFGINEDTLVRWRASYGTGGVEALVAQRPGPRGPSKLTEEKRAEIRELRATGRSMEEIAALADVSLNSVSRALRPLSPPTPARVSPVERGALEPLAQPHERSAERQAARAGLITEAPPVICEGAFLPLLGALIVLPPLVCTGLLDAMAELYASGRAAFYGLRSLVLTVVFACLIGEPRAEGLTRLDPRDFGRLLGLDRAPEVRTIRRRMEELAKLGRADELIEHLARRHVAAHGEATGIFYLDGHVRAYHGSAEIQKQHVARIRLSMPAELDSWLCDANGDGVLVWTAAPGASLVGELRQVTKKIRQLVGKDTRPTICFDRGGWSPKLFAELRLSGFDILTYRKGTFEVEPNTAFALRSFKDAAGTVHDYLLSDRRVRISYDGGRRRFSCRQITRLDERTGHQTTVLTTREDANPAEIAHLMFSRWRQENFFRYTRAHYGLDALDSYETAPDDPGRLVVNPARREADRRLRAARTSLAEAEAEEGRDSISGGHPSREVLKAFAEAREEVERLREAARAIPAKLPLSELRPGAARLSSERKRIHDAMRMATYNAESTLARLAAPHYARAEDEARSLLREMFRASGDLEVVGAELHVRLSPLSAPRRTRALADLCTELTATKTTYPGTKLTLVYSVKEEPGPRSDDGGV